MSILNNKIQSKIKLSRERISAINNQINKLASELEVERAKLETWEEANALATQSRKGRTSSSRTASGDWRAIFDSVARKHDGQFDYDDILRIAQDIKVSIKRGSLRAKMMQYIEKGYVDRIEDGKFKIGTEGYSFFGIIPPTQSSSNPQPARKTAWDQFKASDAMRQAR